MHKITPRLRKSKTFSIREQKYVLIQARTDSQVDKSDKFTKKLQLFWRPKKTSACDKNSTFSENYCSCCSRRIKNEERFAKYYKAIRDVGLVPVNE